MTPVTAIVPARHASERMPAKMLADLAGAPLIVRVCENLAASEVFARIVVATDHADIQGAVEAAGFEAVMTSVEIPSGTDRVAAAAAQLGLPDDALVLNAQGDEPFVTAPVFAALADALREDADAIMTACEALTSEATLIDHNAVKVAIGEGQRALYFSRSPIPHVRDPDQDEKTLLSHHFRHLGIYGYPLRILRAITALPIHPLEALERLEQLRWLAHGYPVHCVQVNGSPRGIDTPLDFEKATKLYAQLHG